MLYTVRYGHLKEPPFLKENDTVHPGDKIGIMGSTGQSKVNHLHLDVIEGSIDEIIRLENIGYENYNAYKPNIIQLNYFIDKDLFKIEPVITTYFYEPEYKKIFNKNHPAYDVVPEDRHLTDEHFVIYWNRSRVGRVLKTGYDIGYGNYILIEFSE